jgi:hypothetical protein
MSSKNNCLKLKNSVLISFSYGKKELTIKPNSKLSTSDPKYLEYVKEDNCEEMEYDLKNKPEKSNLKKNEIHSGSMLSK